MATLVYVDKANENGGQVMAAIEKIRAGLGTLQEYNGLRSEAIAAGAATMASVFGVQDSTQAQALSDRWVALLDATYTSTDLSPSENE